MDRRKLYGRIDFMRMHNCNSLGDPSVVEKIARHTMRLLAYLSDAYSKVPHFEQAEIAFFLKKLRAIADRPEDRVRVDAACRQMCDKIREPQNDMYSRIVFGGDIGTLLKLDKSALELIANVIIDRV